jgi:hypothetical protein
MLIDIPDNLSQDSSRPGFTAKVVFNQHGALIFSAKHQHRDVSAENISYRDNYEGNALAAILTADSIEIRFHRAFSDAQVIEIVRSLLAAPQLSCLRGRRVTYQGRVLAI